MSPVDTLANVGLLIVAVMMSFGAGYAVGHIIWALVYIVKEAYRWVKSASKIALAPYRYLLKKINDYRLYQAMEETRALDEKRRLSRVAQEALSPANQRILPVNHITHPRMQ